MENDLAAHVRVVDKVPPQVAWLNKSHQKVFNDYRVEFKSANLINPASCKNAFSDMQFHYVFNCASETKLGQTDPVYEEGVYQVGKNCMTAAASCNAWRYIELSTGQMYSSEKTCHKEDDKVEPWTIIDKYKHKVEEELSEIDLSYNILRPGIIYGIGDKSGLGARIIIAGLYKYLGEKMTLFWSKDLFMNTVHVRDVCRALWHLATIEKDGGIYNLVDEGKTTQGILTEALSEVFSINHDYWGNVASSLCKVDMNTVVDEINDKHLAPWAKLCNQNGVVNTPLSPYIHKEQLHNKHLYLSTDKIKLTGFEVSVPEITADYIKEIVKDYIDMNMFPKSLLS